MSSGHAPQETAEGGGFAAADFPVRRAVYGPAPPASRVLRIALRATALRAALDPGDLGGPWGRRSGQASALPCQARGAHTQRGWRERGCWTPAHVSELAFDNQKKAENYANLL